MAGYAVIESGTGAVATERVAILLVPLPTELLTTKVNWAPLSELVSAAGGGRAADGCAIFVGDDATTSATHSSDGGRGSHGASSVDSSSCRGDSQGSPARGTLAGRTLCTALAMDAAVPNACGNHHACLAQPCWLFIIRWAK